MPILISFPVVTNKFQISVTCNNKCLFLAQFHVSSFASAAVALLHVPYRARNRAKRAAPLWDTTSLLRPRGKGKTQSQTTQLPLKLLLGCGICISIGWNQPHGQVDMVAKCIQPIGWLYKPCGNGWECIIILQRRGLSRGYNDATTTRAN